MNALGEVSADQGRGAEHGAAGDRHGASSSTAAAGCRDDFPLAAAWVERPVAAARRRARRGAPRRGRRASSSASTTAMSRVLVTGAASGLGRGADPRLPRRAATRCWRPMWRDGVVSTTAPTAPCQSPDGSTSPPTTTGRAARDWVERALGRARRPGQQRRRRRRRPHRRRRHRRVAVDHRHQPARRGPRLPDVHAGVQAPALGPDRQRRLARRAGAPGRDGVVQRGEGRRRRAHRDPRPRARARTACSAHVVCPSYFRTNLLASLRGADAGARARSSASWSRARRSPPTTSRRPCSRASTRATR